jgi:hypothetical protein
MRKHTNAPTLVNRARRMWHELDYAQRRLFELQTGVDTGARRRRA